MTLILGMNYGNDYFSAPFDHAQVTDDCARLKAGGYHHIRSSYPAFFGNMSGDAGYFIFRDLASWLVAEGMTVNWGGTIAYNPFTATNFSDYATFLTTVQAPWAEANGIAEFSIGNELELTVDGTTLTVSALQAALRSLATTISGIFSGPITYTAAAFADTITQWAADKGDIDNVGFNVYAGRALNVFTAGVDSVTAAFPSGGAYISEWGTFPGIGDQGQTLATMGLGNTQRLAYMKAQSILKPLALPRAYYFTFRSNPDLGNADLYSLFDGTSNDLRFGMAQGVGLGRLTA
jgi:hypothetical protein